MLDELPHVCRPIIEYRCARCGRTHRGGLDPEYRPHMRHAQRTDERPPTPNEVLERLAKEPQ